MSKYRIVEISGPMDEPVYYIQQRWLCFWFDIKDHGIAFLEVNLTLIFNTIEEAELFISPLNPANIKRIKRIVKYL